MGTLSAILLSIGFSLMVMGIRFVMVSNSLKAGKPSEQRRKTLHREFMVCLILGVILFIWGILGRFIFIPIQVAQTVANTGGIIFGLAIPQYNLYYYSKDEKKYQLAQKQLNNWIGVLLTIGAILIIISPIINWLWNL